MTYPDPVPSAPEEQPVPERDSPDAGEHNRLMARPARRHVRPIEEIDIPPNARTVRALLDRHRVIE